MSSIPRDWPSALAFPHLNDENPSWSRYVPCAQTSCEGGLSLTNMAKVWFDDSGYFQFYPATTAARHRDVEKIGFCTTGMRLIPKQWRNMVVENDDGTARTWNICDEKSRVVRHTLSAAERALPIGEIINHPLLCERLEEQWTPARYEKVT